MMEIGRLCVKTAGRDAGKTCVITDVLENNYVLIDGETRRRKCNILHLEPLDRTIEIQKGASHEQVVKAFETIGITMRPTKPKPKQARPRKARRSKLATQAQTQQKTAGKEEKTKPALTAPV